MCRKCWKVEVGAGGESGHQGEVGALRVWLHLKKMGRKEAGIPEGSDRVQGQDSSNWRKTRSFLSDILGYLKREVCSIGKINRCFQREIRVHLIEKLGYSYL